VSTRRVAGAALGLWLAIGCKPAAGQVTLGVRLGLSQSTIYEDRANPSWRTGLAAGVFMEAVLTPHLALRPELSFTQKGATSEDYVFTGDPPTPRHYSLHRNFEYVQLGMLAHLRTTPLPGAPRLGLFAGPILATLVHSQVQRDEGNTWTESGLKQRSIGLATGVDVARDRLRLEIRYEVSDNQRSPAGGSYLFHHYVAVSLGLGIA
jgi:hypothetical protein